MRIEEISKATVGEATDQELLMLRLRTNQLWDKHFAKGDGPEVVGTLSRGDILQKYRLLVSEMAKRSLEKSTSDIDRQVFKMAMRARAIGIDFGTLEDVTVVKNAVFATEKILEDAEALPVCISKQVDLTSACEALAGITDRTVEIDGTLPEADSEVLPIYDLVLRPTHSTKLTKSSLPSSIHGGIVLEVEKTPATTLLTETPKVSKMQHVSGTGFINLLVAGLSEVDVATLKKQRESIDQSKTAGGKLAMVLRRAVKTKHCSAGLVLKSDEFNLAGLVDVGTVSNLGRLSSLDDTAFTHDESLLCEDSWFAKADNTINALSNGGHRKSSVPIPLESFGFTLVYKSDDAIRFKISGSSLMPEGEYIVKMVGDKWVISKRRKNEKFVDVTKLTEKDDEQIIYGVVYEPDAEDAQGEFARAEDIREAAHQFMQSIQTFKVNHKGRPAKVRVLESYIAPQDLTIEGLPVRAGTWVMAARVLDKKLWKAVKDGTITGFSMAGTAVRLNEEIE